jgi:hypothetical protein
MLLIARLAAVLIAIVIAWFGIQDFLHQPGILLWWITPLALVKLALSLLFVCFAMGGGSPIIRGYLRHTFTGAVAVGVLAFALGMIALSLIATPSGMGYETLGAYLLIGPAGFFIGAVGGAMRAMSVRSVQPASENSLRRRAARIGRSSVAILVGVIVTWVIAARIDYAVMRVGLGDAYAYFQGTSRPIVVAAAFVARGLVGMVGGLLVGWIAGRASARHGAAVAAIVVALTLALARSEFPFVLVCVVATIVGSVLSTRELA